MLKKQYILGISAFYHDSAACLICDGDIIAAVQEERFTRRKHDQSFPEKAIEYCLSEGGIDIKEVDYIAFYDKPFLKFERILETYLAYAPCGIRSFLSAIPVWIKEKIWMKELISKELGFKGKIIFPEHHESHAASAFFPSPFQKAALLTMDGVGEWTTTSFGNGDGNKINILADINFPHSLGLLYSAFTYYLGFKVNSGEYKMMGLAPYGTPKYRDVIERELIDTKGDGSFKMNMKYFNYCTGLSMTNKHFDKLFGGPRRKPESQLTQRHMDIAASVQCVLEDIVLKIAKHIKKVTGEENLAMAGGVALNCVTNGKLLRSGIFKNIWIQPSSTDAGGALGAALFVWYQYLNNRREADGIKDYQHGSYLGPQYPSSFIEDFLKKNNIPHEKIKGDMLLDKVAELINKDKVIGWFQGRMEFGPRALGARSIIGDARSPLMQKKMNLKIKFRESFRPFAPSVLSEKTSDYFNLRNASPYMLLVANIADKELKILDSGDKQKTGFEKLGTLRSTVPAITHVDNSARVQTVHRDTNPTYHKLIEIFNNKYGCPVIINTSFNVRGEPIVCSPEDAFRCFMRTEMDYLVLGEYIVDKRKQDRVEKDTSWQEEFELD